jgi:branched-chain amino acid transport system ATP-binding protein
MTEAPVKGKPLLEFDHVDTYYGQIHILNDVSLQVGTGELVCLLGGNASGKSTTLKTTLGIVRPHNGRVLFDGEDLAERNTSYRIGRGMAIVPENRRLFAPMSVLENLEMGAYLRGGGTKEDFERVYSLFPLLYERRAQLAGTLSGGEQQMLSMSRALATSPALLMLDELSMGLAPLIVEQLYEIVGQLAQQGISILIVEQFAQAALGVATTASIMLHGQIVHSGAPHEVATELRAIYLGTGEQPRHEQRRSQAT